MNIIFYNSLIYIYRKIVHTTVVDTHIILGNRQIALKNIVSLSLLIVYLVRTIALTPE